MNELDVFVAAIEFILIVYIAIIVTVTGLRQANQNNEG
jgi:hypothetical protein